MEEREAVESSQPRLLDRAILRVVLASIGDKGHHMAKKVVQRRLFNSIQLRADVSRALAAQDVMEISTVPFRKWYATQVSSST